MRTTSTSANDNSQALAITIRDLIRTIGIVKKAKSEIDFVVDLGQ